MTFASPTPTTSGETESWTLTCTKPDGGQGRPVAVTVDRGEVAELGEVCRGPKS